MEQYAPNHHDPALQNYHRQQHWQQNQLQYVPDAVLPNHHHHHDQQQQHCQQQDADPFEALVNHPALKMRLDLWKKEEEVVSQRIDRKELRLQNTKNEIYQLLGIYFVFQGVILTAIAQATNLPESKLWIPLVLSILASISTILALWYKLGDCSDLEKHITSEKMMAKALYQASDTLKSLGNRFNPMDFSLQPHVRTDQNSSGEAKKPPMARQLWDNHMRWYGALLILILLIFSVIMAISCCLIHTEHKNEQKTKP